MMPFDVGPAGRTVPVGVSDVPTCVIGAALARELSALGGPDVPAAAADYTTGYLAALGTMAALRRRSIEGGAYHVRASLCQTATWIAEDGPWVDPSTATGVGDITPWLVEERTPFGVLTHLTPELDANVSREQAEAVWDGSVDVATPGSVWEVSG